MKVNIIKVTSVLSIILASLFLISCGGKEHKEGDGHDHSTSQESSKESHSEEAENIATLTEDQIKTAGIELGSIEQKSLTGSLKAIGKLRVPNKSKANATSLFGGVIKTLTVELGDYVRKGQVIATISNPQFVQLQEEYSSIQSRITFAEQELERQRELNEGNAGAKKNLQNATAELSTLRARKASLQQQIQMMGINPNNIANNNFRSSLTVTSPIDGTISDVFAKIGSYVDVSSPIVEIINNNSIHLDLQVFEKDLPLIKVGQKINFTITNNPQKSYAAKVTTIGSSFSGESKSIAVHSEIIGDKSGLIDGMNITGLVSLDDVLTSAVPNEAIVEADGKYYIFIKTDKEPEEHNEGGHDDHGHGHDEGEATHGHKNEKEASEHATQAAQKLNFEKIEVAKGTSNMGYTAITPVKEIPQNAQIVTKGAFFINAKLSNTGGHSH